MIDKFHKHIGKLISERYGSQTKFANHLGVSVSFVNQVLSGKKKITSEMLNSLGILKIVAYQIEDITYIEEC